MGLAIELADHFGIVLSGTPDLAQVAQIVELRKGRAELQGFLTKRLHALEPNENVLSLLSHRWGAIFTTNYDRVIERAYELLADPVQTPVVISATSELVETDPRFEVPIYHIHGALFSGERPSVLITQEDYARFSEKRRMLFALLKQSFATTPFLYVGYSQRDPNWRTLQSEMRAEFAPRRPPRSYRVAPSTDPLDVEILNSMEIETLNGDLGMLVAATAGLDRANEIDRLKQIEASVPSDLLDAFHENPAATARLLSSWQYVNSAPFDAPLDIKAYLAGDLPTWAVVSENQTFERDVEAPLYDEMLDYATSDRSSPTAVALLGSAGYGVSSVLMKTAARLVREQAGPVFMHKGGTPLVEGDIEFAVSVLGGRPFFVVDNAADVGSEVVAAVRRLRDLKKPGCFLLGERLNEWRQRRLRISPIELEIEPLSDQEIPGVLAYLRRHGALNQLEGLDPQLQFAAIKEKHEKQLLVALREATEGGAAFDAIIEDEYRAIDSEQAQMVYAAVCATYRLRVPVRMEVLADVLDINLVELYDAVGPAVEGILRVETIDEAKGIHAARARHQVIAEIIWERVIDQAERDRLLQRTLGALNLVYVLDVRTFEAFVRDDRGIDAIGSFEGKVNFFERATLKDPEDPYVLQHYARMLLREDRADLALSIIDRAVGIRSSVRVLQHTKGLILAHMALNIESSEIARRRLAQSEAAFRASFGPQRRDAYTYQSLAELYLGWAKRSDPEEAAEYVTKAENAIREGLIAVHDREGLWIVSAKVQEFLGNRPEALEALVRAVRESPTSPVARYLLARAYFRARKWREVIETLKPALEQDPQEFRSAVVYAKSLERMNEPYAQPVAILRLAELYGRRDPRFVATLGGMLTMQGEFTSASNVFAESRNTMSYREANRIEYEPRPGDEGSPVLHGTVINVRSGYAFVQSPGYPDFFWPGKFFGSLDVRRGLRIAFRPAFTARGGVITRASKDTSV